MFIRFISHFFVNRDVHRLYIDMKCLYIFALFDHSFIHISNQGPWIFVMITQFLEFKKFHVLYYVYLSLRFSLIVLLLNSPVFVQIGLGKQCSHGSDCSYRNILIRVYRL